MSRALQWARAHPGDPEESYSPTDDSQDTAVIVLHDFGLLSTNATYAWDAQEGCAVDGQHWPHHGRSQARWHERAEEQWPAAEAEPRPGALGMTVAAAGVHESL